MALSAEIKVLERELLSQPVRVDLLKAKRDREAASVVRIGRRVDALDHLVNDKRELEAEAASAATRRMLRATAPLDPILVRLAEQNAELTDRLNAIAGGSSPTSTCAGFSCRRRLRASPIRTWTLRISRPSSPPIRRRGWSARCAN